jgi:hypothetical protein
MKHMITNYNPLSKISSQESTLNQSVNREKKLLFFTIESQVDVKETRETENDPWANRRTI